jgi:hypothetical protein
MNAEIVAVVEGPSVMLGQMSREAFQRAWTGYALVAAPRRNDWFRFNFAKWLGTALAAYLFLFAGTSLWRLLKGRHSKAP